MIVWKKIEIDLAAERAIMGRSTHLSSVEKENILKLYDLLECGYMTEFLKFAVSLKKDKPGHSELDSLSIKVWEILEDMAWNGTEYKR